MSVDAKVFVTWGKDKFADVINSVVKGLNIWQRERLDEVVKEGGWNNRFHFIHNQGDNPLWTNGVTIHAYNMDIIAINFSVGEHRSLKAFPDCYSSASQVYEGEKILFSIGHWGRCEEIMKVVGSCLHKFGDVYYDHNDCDDEDFVKVEF